MNYLMMIKAIYNFHVYVKVLIFLGKTKLAMNAVFGTTMENVRSHVNIELISNNKFFKKRIAKPNFKGSKRIHDDLVAVELTK